MTKAELIERLAAIEHQRWSEWQAWVHAVYNNPTRPFEEAIKNWQRQINTPYADLTEREQRADRDQVMRYWSLIEDYIAERTADVRPDDSNS